MSYVMILLLVACVKPQDDDSAIDVNAELVSSVFTKGIGSGKAYRVYLNGLSGTVTQGVETSGTYCDLIDGFQFVPCSVTDKGEYSASDDTKGLRAINGNYKMHIAYPAVAMAPIPYQGCEGMNGYFFKRRVDPGDVMLYLSEVKDVTLNGVYLTDERNSYYIYDASTMVLKQPRSLINIYFACGSKIQSTTLHKILLSNVIKEGYFRPVDGVFYYSDANVSKGDDMVVLYGDDASETAITLNAGQQILAVEDVYLLSMDYSAKDASGAPLWPLPKFVFVTGEDDEQVIDLNASLAMNFQPQHTYDMIVTVNSTYTNINIVSVPWTDEGGDTSVSDQESWSVDIPHAGMDWDDAGDMSGVID